MPLVPDVVEPVDPVLPVFELEPVPVPVPVPVEDPLALEPVLLGEVVDPEPMFPVVLPEVPAEDPLLPAPDPAEPDPAPAPPLWANAGTDRTPMLKTPAANIFFTLRSVIFFSYWQ